MGKLLYLFFFIPLVSFGQDYGNDAEALKICTYLQGNNFVSNNEADKSLDKILSVIGASKRFVLQPCSNTNNAVATSYRGIRYIFYDREFLSTLDTGDNWSNLFILAHEVGHHINGHTLDLVLYAAEAVEPESFANQRQQELEADEFAAFIIGKLGGKLEQINKTISVIAPIEVGPYSTHPNRIKRLSAVNTGYTKAFSSNRIKDKYNTTQDKSEEYFYGSVEKYINNDINGAYSEYEKFIGSDSNEKEFNELIKKINSPNYKGRCNAITKAGNQCKRTAKIDSSFCWQHNNSNQSDALIGRCEAITKAGTQCKRKASDDKGFCWQHK